MERRHHIIEAPLSHMVFESLVGGNVYDVGTHGSEVEVTFTAETPERTRVELEHRHLERHGDDLAPQLDGIRQGWQAGGLDLFAATITRG